MSLPDPIARRAATDLPIHRNRPTFGVRVADIAALADDGHTIIGQRRVPTLRAFDHVFAAFAQGTVFHSRHGLMAVEDLRPGDWLTTAGGAEDQVTWIGSTTFSPIDLGERIRLTRVMPDSFGVSRPEHFASFGPAARLLQTPPALRGTAGARSMMTPVDQFIDGTNVIEVSPPTPVRLFHVATRCHSALRAGGLEVESFHPGHSATEGFSPKLTEVYLSLFPHVKQLSDLGPLTYARAPDIANRIA